MKLEQIFKNIQKQNKLRKELNIKELALVGKFAYDEEKKEYKTFKEFIKDFDNVYIESLVKEVLNTNYDVEKIEIGGHAFILEEI